MAQKLLFLDDSPLAHERVLKAFSKTDIQVQCTSSWVQVKIEVFSDDPPDLLLLDINMPALDGVSVGRAIKRRRGISIIVYSSESAECLIKATQEIGAEAYLSKSADDMELVSLAQKLLILDQPMQARGISQ